MVRLARLIRFSINPFSDTDPEGYNSFCSKPTAEGMALFFEICVELTGSVNPATGFIVNVADIDEVVGDFIVPLFGNKIRELYRQGVSIDLSYIVTLLNDCWPLLNDKFHGAQLNKIALNLNPHRKVSIGDKDMVCLSEKFDFAATHKLWNDDYDEQKNLEVFGKCANPAGHGHNYILEVTVSLNEKEHFSMVEFERMVDEHFLQLVDHKNLNAEVPEFKRTIPTVENIAALAWDKLESKFTNAALETINVWENDRTCCTYQK